MSRLIVANSVTLDGVMQAPGRPDEDTRGGFRHGGWAVATSDEAMTQAMAVHASPAGGGFLFGRRTYQGLLSTWNKRGGPFKEGLNSARKYVASSSGSTKLDWPNSTLLQGDVPGAISELKQQLHGNLVIMGSGALIRSLLPYSLIDEFFLMIHPVVLGSGMRMFPEGGTSLRLQLVDSTRTATGVILATYRNET